jgi:hypothetical protein
MAPDVGLVVGLGVSGLPDGLGVNGLLVSLCEVGAVASCANAVTGNKPNIAPAATVASTLVIDVFLVVFRPAKRNLGIDSAVPTEQLRCVSGTSAYVARPTHPSLPNRVKAASEFFPSQDKARPNVQARWSDELSDLIGVDQEVPGHPRGRYFDE